MTTPANEQVPRPGGQHRLRATALVVASAALVGAVLVTSLTVLRPHADTSLSTPVPATGSPQPPTSAAITPSATTPPPTTPPAVTVPPTSSKPLSGLLTIRITGLPAAPILAVGGPSIQFTVVITNGTAITYDDFTPIVSLAHCTCTQTPVPMAPDGTLAVRQPDGTWMTVFFDREGGGTDFLRINQVGAVTLHSGASISFTYRMSLNASQVATVTNGETSLDVTLVNLPAYIPILGASKGVPLRITVA
jgi:hypothetical protein